MIYRILIVEDDAAIASRLATNLARYEYEPVLIRDFSQVEQEFLEVEPHLVILDVNLPYQDGFHLCRAIRRHSPVPILFLTARAGEMEQVLGIELGGDEYVTKPFHLDVLHAKIKALLRRTYGEYARNEGSSGELKVGRLVLDLATGGMRYGQEHETLTRNELKLLHLLMVQAGKVVSRADCLDALWDDSSFVNDNTLTVNVTRVRNKLNQWGLGEAIETRRGLGYRLVPERLEGSPC